MKIKLATLSEIDQVLPLFSAYRAFYGKKENTAGSKEFLESRFRESDTKLYLATIDNQPAGFVHLFPLFSSTRLARYWLLNDLYVAENYRGKGISKALINQAKQLCRDTDACGMYLETGKDNAIGNKLYPATGFKWMGDVNFYEWSTRAD